MIWWDACYGWSKPKRLPRKDKKRLKKAMQYTITFEIAHYIDEMVYEEMVKNTESIMPDWNEVAKAWPQMDQAQWL